MIVKLFSLSIQNIRVGFSPCMLKAGLIIDDIIGVCFCAQTAPPRNITLSIGETAVNLSWVSPERQRNIGFHIRYLRKNGKL